MSGDQLKVKVLLDYTRGSRGERNSCHMLQPLLVQYQDICQVLTRIILASTHVFQSSVCEMLYFHYTVTNYFACTSQKD
jgi:hypothetical protein